MKIRSLIQTITVVISLSVSSLASIDAASRGSSFTVINPIRIDCGVETDAYIDPSDDFVKVKATNTCDVAKKFVVIIYRKDGGVDRHPLECLGAHQTRIYTIGSSSWIKTVKFSDLEDC